MSSLDPLYQLMQPGNPTKAANFPGDPTVNHPYYLTSGTNTEIILNLPSASANMTDPCARDIMTSCDPPGQSLSPTTPASAADLHNVLPPHAQNRTRTGIILCLPARQNTSPFTGKIDAASVFCADTGGIGEKTIKRRRTPCENYVGIRVPLQSNIPVRPKELTRDETRRMLMDKARREVNRYLDD